MKNHEKSFDAIIVVNDGTTPPHKRWQLAIQGEIISKQHGAHLIVDESIPISQQVPHLNLKIPHTLGYYQKLTKRIKRLIREYKWKSILFIFSFPAVIPHRNFLKSFKGVSVTEDMSIKKFFTQK